MLQRIQSIYLFIAVLGSSVVAFLAPFWVSVNKEVVRLLDLLNTDNGLLLSIPILFVISVLFSCIALLSFKNRTKQIVSNRINIVINFLLIGIIVYHLLNLPGESNVSEKGIGVFIPLVVIVFLVLANKAILKDEKLVKSVDRLR